MKVRFRNVAVRIKFSSRMQKAPLLDFSGRGPISSSSTGQTVKQDLFLHVAALAICGSHDPLLIERLQQRTIGGFTWLLSALTRF